MSSQANGRRRAVATTSWLAIGVALSCAPAYAQAPSGAGQDATVADVIVVGARASQQSSIDRKKRASTPTDSIVADDVGSFPDRNLNEAISRVAGTALSRNDYGEGDGVSIRGNSPDFTRVELDGIGVQSAGGALTSGLSESGRGADMRELPADLIKSVDIIKGSTADMTEGSLGGSIQITTRSGLDFKKPYLSVRLGTTQNDLGEKYGHDINLIASRKFLDDRLGAIFSVTSTNVQNNSDQMQTVTSGRQGYARSIDWDNSPEKTFTFDPTLVNGDTADTIMANSTFTPRQVAALSAAATTKAGCLTAFPFIVDPRTPAQAATNNENLANQKNQRIQEQLSCLNQWNDYHPSLVRNFSNVQDEDRLAADLRFDFRVTDNLKVYAKYAIANRKVNDQTLNRNLGGVNINPTVNGLSAFVDTPPYDNGASPPVNLIPASTNITITRRGLPSLGTYTYNDNQLTGSATRDMDPTATTRNYTFPVIGQAVNVIPSSVEMDENHHVTRMELTGLSTQIDQISNVIDTKSSYAQVGAEYWEGPLRVEFVGNRSESAYTRADKRTARTYDYGTINGNVVMQVQPSGLWSYELPAGYDETDPDNFVFVNKRLGAQSATAATYTNPAGKPAYAASQRVLTSQVYGLSFSPKAEEGEETSLKLDVTYDLREKSPLLTRFKTGVSYRDSQKRWWGSGGYEVSSARGTYNPALSPEANVQAGYVPAVTVPTLTLRGGIRACTPAGTGIDPISNLPYEQCVYGYQPGTDGTNPDPLRFTPNRFELQGMQTMTEAELRELTAATTLAPKSTFFDGYPGVDGLSSFGGIDVDKFFAASGMNENVNFDCLYRCMGSDGQMYDQPVNSSSEKIMATYAMLDFEHDLPLGMSFEGNVGIRRVDTEVGGNALLTFASVRRNVPGNPNSAVTTYNLRRQFTFTNRSIDILPSYNLSLWILEDKLALRGYTAKTITRPPISRLIPNGTCTVDERNENQVDPLGDEIDQQCGRLGNPGLKPYEAQDYNLALEWYPNRDTMFSLAWHKLDVKVGAPINSTRQNYKVFAGTGAVDPETGKSLEDVEFTVPSYENGPGFERTGLEFTSKTAFTFLPWFLRHTGADFNYSKLDSSGNATYIDPLTGEGQPTPNEATYFGNLSLWYDDGRLNARVSWQNKGESFICISACGDTSVTNLPTGNPGELVRLPYNPGEPYYRAETKYVDAKVSYKLRPNLEVYAEGRNLTQEANIVLGSDRTGFSDGTPNLWSIGYGGRRFMLGLVYRYGAQ